MLKVPGALPKYRFEFRFSFRKCTNFSGSRFCKVCLSHYETNSVDSNQTLHPAKNIHPITRQFQWPHYDFHLKTVKWIVSKITISSEKLKFKLSFHVIDIHFTCFRDLNFWSLTTKQTWKWTFLQPSLTSPPAVHARRFIHCYCLNNVNHIHSLPSLLSRCAPLRCVVALCSLSLVAD